MAGILGFNNYLINASVFSEDTETGFPFSNCIDGRTSTTVGLESGASRVVILNLGSAKQITAAGFARSNLFSVGATITFAGSSSSGGTYADFLTITPATKKAHFQTFDSVSWQYVRVTVSGHSGNSYVSDIYVGDYVTLPCSVDRNFSPPEYSDNDETKTNITYSIETVGTTIKQKLKTAQFKFDTLDIDWIEQHWDEFSSYIKSRPFYWVWKTGKQPFFCWPEKSVGGLKYSSDGQYYTTSFKLQGLIE